VIGQSRIRISITFGTTGGIIDPLSSLRSGTNRSQAGCGPPPRISPSIGVLPKAIMPPVTMNLRTSLALLMPSQGDCAALTITALMATSTGPTGALTGMTPPRPEPGMLAGNVRERKVTAWIGRRNILDCRDLRRHRIVDRRVGRYHCYIGGIGGRI
jgi:hypothetical protein